MKEEVVDINKVQSIFQDWEKQLNGKAASAGHLARKASLDSFLKTGFPGPKTEAWKYTHLSSLLKKGFYPAPSYEMGDIAPESFNSMVILPGNSNRLVFVDGLFSKELSVLTQVKGLKIAHAGATPAAPDVSDVKLSDESLIDLNAAFTLDGAQIEVEAGAIIESPVEIYNITTCPGHKIIQPRHRIKVGRSAEVTFVQSYHNLCVGQSFTNAVNEIEIAANAKVTLVKFEHPRKPNTYIIDHTMIRQDRDSSLEAFTMTLSGAMVRNNLKVHLAGENTSTDLKGLYMLNKEDHTDNRTLVVHAVPNCYSNELYKGILDGKSTGVFNGKIIVEQDAQKTNAYQNNRNILVSDDATINSKPQLEIFADDVKCSHGATSSRIEDSELFYLRSRGIGKEKARALLMYAFAAETWDGVSHDGLRNYIENSISQTLGIDLN